MWIHLKWREVTQSHFWHCSFFKYCSVERQGFSGQGQCFVLLVCINYEATISHPNIILRKILKQGHQFSAMMGRRFGAESRSRSVVGECSCDLTLAQTVALFHRSDFPYHHCNCTFYTFTVSHYLYISHLFNCIDSIGKLWKNLKLLTVHKQKYSNTFSKLLHIFYI